MHAEIFLAIMVLAVALLVAADFFRRTSEGPHEHAERPAHDAGRGAFAPPRSAGAAAGSGAATPVTAFEPARTGRPGSTRAGSVPGSGAGFSIGPATGPSIGAGSSRPSAGGGARGTAPARGAGGAE